MAATSFHNLPDCAPRAAVFGSAAAGCGAVGLVKCSYATVAKRQV
mgnify:CR=1 FL=1